MEDLAMTDTISTNPNVATAPLTTVPTDLAAGVLPDPVIRDPRADGTLLFIALRPDLDQAGAIAWLTSVNTLLAELTAGDNAVGSQASAAVGFGPSFFGTAATPRFGLPADRIPAGFADLPIVAVTDPLVHTDLVIYIMSRSAGAAARFMTGLSATRPTLAGVTVARGYQRDDRRELFGFRDGLRNTNSEDRARVVFVDRDDAPDEPAWLQDGTYMAYLRVHQDLDRFATLATADAEKIFGRRKDDGSRLDLPAGTDPKTEGPLTPTMPGNAHVAKAGPRGGNDAVRIFRRGVPYLDLAPDGSLVGGLQFVSFQSSLDNFDAILSRWMLNPDFAAAGTGVDALFAQGFATIERAGFFVVPPADPRFIGAGIFDEPKPPTPELGRLIVRKKVLDSSGAHAEVDLGGIGFQIVRAADGLALGPVFTTLPNGHALSPEVPMHTPLLLREVAPPPNTDPAADLPFTLTRRRDTLVPINHRRQPGPYGR
jgi:Dyp-type peroxidase family